MVESGIRKGKPLNGIFFSIVLIAFGVAAWRQLTWVGDAASLGAMPMEALGTAMIDAAAGSVDPAGIVPTTLFATIC